jgi:hypothetical protein
MSNHSSSIRAFFIFKVFYQYIIAKETTGDCWKKGKLPPSEEGKGQSQQLIRGVPR